MNPKNQFPQGGDEERVRRVLEHYETQSEAEAVAEDEAAHEDRTQAVIEVPVELVPAVRALLAKHKRSA
jgi:hypothetical protein